MYRQLWFFFLDFSNVLGPRQYCDYYYGDDGDGSESSAPKKQPEDNPVIDLTHES